MIEPGYVPNSLETWALIGAAIAGQLVLGALWERVRGPAALVRLGGWGLLIGGVALVERLAAGEPAGLRMLALCGAGLYGMKFVVLGEQRLSGKARLGAKRWLAFVLGWPGMRPAVFAKAFGRKLPGGAELVRKGLVRLAIGAALLALARLAWTETASPLLTALLLLPGLSLAFHFGLFNVGAGCWRFAGADCRELFRAPLEAKSLSNFWSRRWNLAFSEMVQVAAFRPLRPLLGARGATLAGFGLSALLHEMAISLPVGAGYGLPTLYFILHGGLVAIEGALADRGFDIEKKGWLARAWTLGWLALPIALVFHGPFLAGVALPIVGAAW